MATDRSGGKHQIAQKQQHKVYVIPDEEVHTCLGSCSRQH